MHSLTLLLLSPPLQANTNYSCTSWHRFDSHHPYRSTLTIHALPDVALTLTTSTSQHRLGLSLILPPVQALEIVLNLLPASRPPWSWPPPQRPPWPRPPLEVTWTLDVRSQIEGMELDSEKIKVSRNIQIPIQSNASLRPFLLLLSKPSL